MITVRSPGRGRFQGLAVALGTLTGLALLAGPVRMLFNGAEVSCGESEGADLPGSPSPVQGYEE